MSSHSIGPALPPHMRRSHPNNDEDTRNDKKQRDKHDDRTRFKERERSRTDRRRDRDRSRDRSYRPVADKGRSRHRGKREEEEGFRSKRERVSQKRGENIDTSSSKRSKRSKSDRTYNTDTEESSDENSDVKEWTKKSDSDNSDGEQEEKHVETSEPRDEPPCVQEPIDANIDSGKDICKSNEADLVGPALPPHLLKSSSSLSDAEDVEPSRPSTPPDVAKPPLRDEHSTSASRIGPVLPPHLRNNGPDISALSPHPPEDCLVGPALPPHLLKDPDSKASQNDESTLIGPALPAGLKVSTVLGPTLPPGMNLDDPSQVCDSSSDEEVVGPLLPEQMIKSNKNYFVQAQLEQNAAAIKRKLEEKDMNDGLATRREEWMLELPPEGTVDLGLGPRSFRIRGAPEKGADRSAWTDTPADKIRKEEEAKLRFELGMTSTAEVKKEASSKELSNKDRCMEAVVKKHKRSKESLLEAHQKKLKEEKKKKEKASGKQERRPFNRELDLKTNVFDDAQKKSIYKKAQFLDSRFSSGESKYL